MSFKKAEKSKSKLRAAFFGPSGSGKTFSALSVATGIAEATNSKIAVIDSERGSASKYADRFTFDVVNLEKKTIDEYITFIGDAQKEGYGVLIIDSMSHAWQELLEEVDKIAKTKFKGNSWSAWSEGTPKQKRLIDALLSFDGHVIATMRSKTEWQTSDGEGGKKAPIRVGLAPEQGKGIEYEFDLLVEISTEHVANVIKDRTGKFQDQIFDKPGVQFGRSLVEWLNTGVEVQPKHDAIVEKPVAPRTESKPRGVIENALTAIRAAKTVEKIAACENRMKALAWTDGELLKLDDELAIAKQRIAEAV